MPPNDGQASPNTNQPYDEPPVQGVSQPAPVYDQAPSQPQSPSALPGPGMQFQPGMTTENQALQQVTNTNPNSTQNTLHIAEIRDGIVIMNDGTFRSVIMARSINFDLMSPEEREAVEFAYQGFLNSLYFDIQIFMRSQKIDMRPYLEKLDKLRSEQQNMLVALLTEDYMGYIDAISQQTNIMDKKFYLIIPYIPSLALDKPLETGKKMAGGFVDIFKKQKVNIVTINEADLDKAKQELKNRVQSVINGLAQTGVQALPLNTQELIELYYDYYNPDTATRQQLKNFDGISAPVITKGNEAGGQY